MKGFFFALIFEIERRIVMIPTATRNYTTTRKISSADCE